MVDRMIRPTKLLKLNFREGMHSPGNEPVNQKKLAVRIKEGLPSFENQRKANNE